MTPERKEQLQRTMDLVITREIKHAVATMGEKEIAQHISDLSHIYTCIGSAYDLLSGDAFKRLGDSIAASMKKWR